MTISLILLIAIVVLLFYIRNKVNDIHKQAQESLDKIVNQAVRPVETVAGIGAAVAETAIKAVKAIKKK